MGTITVTMREGSSRAVDAQSGLSLMEIIRGNGFDELLAICGGGCSCSTCHIYVDPAHVGMLEPPGQDEDELLDSSGHRTPLSRLACQVPFTPALDGIAVNIAPED
jgi:2Fe-2S ferredoxin